MPSKKEKWAMRVVVGGEIVADYPPARRKTPCLGDRFHIRSSTPEGRIVKGLHQVFRVNPLFKIYYVASVKEKGPRLKS